MSNFISSPNAMSNSKMALIQLLLITINTRN